MSSARSKENAARWLLLVATSITCLPLVQGDDNYTVSDWMNETQLYEFEDDAVENSTELEVDPPELFPDFIAEENADNATIETEGPRTLKDFSELERDLPELLPNQTVEENEENATIETEGDYHTVIDWMNETQLLQLYEFEDEAVENSTELEVDSPELLPDLIAEENAENATIETKDISPSTFEAFTELERDLPELLPNQTVEENEDNATIETEGDNHTVIDCMNETQLFQLYEFEDEAVENSTELEVDSPELFPDLIAEENAENGTIETKGISPSTFENSSELELDVRELLPNQTAEENTENTKIETEDISPSTFEDSSELELDVRELLPNQTAEENTENTKIETEDISPSTFEDFTELERDLPELLPNQTAEENTENTTIETVGDNHTVIDWINETQLNEYVEDADENSTEFGLDPLELLIELIDEENTEVEEHHQNSYMSRFIIMALVLHVSVLGIGITIYSCVYWQIRSLRIRRRSRETRRRLQIMSLQSKHVPNIGDCPCGGCILAREMLQGLIMQQLHEMVEC